MKQEACPHKFCHNRQGERRGTKTQRHSENFRSQVSQLFSFPGLPLAGTPRSQVCQPKTARKQTTFEQIRSETGVPYQEWNFQEFQTRREHRESLGSCREPGAAPKSPYTKTMPALSFCFASTNLARKKITLKGKIQNASFPFPHLWFPRLRFFEPRVERPT